MTSARVRDVLLVTLTVSTGAVDAVSWFGLGKVFSAFMTGNIAFLGFRAAGAPGPPVPRVLTAIVAFAVGAGLAAWIVGRSRNDRQAWPHRVTVALGLTVLAQAAFLGSWISVNGAPSARAGDALIAMSALAMGIQTTAVFSLGVRAVFTTAATATLAVLMGDISSWSESRGERWRLASVVLALFGGAAIGAFLFVHAPTAAPAFPLAVSCAAVLAAELVWGSRSIRIVPRPYAT